MPDERNLESPGRPLSKEQKIGFVLLLLFSIFTVALGMLQIRNTMYAPFALNNKIPDYFKEQINTVEALKYRDTDRDGLTDFDELYVYGTSPYLYDTFSYGMSDKDVITKGLPLCPLGGKNCNNPIISDSAQTPVENILPTTTNEVVNFDFSELSKTLQDPAQIRQMLLDNGLDKAVLQKVSDKELMNLVTDAMGSASILEQIKSAVGAVTSTVVR